MSLLWSQVRNNSSPQEVPAQLYRSHIHQFIGELPDTFDQYTPEELHIMILTADGRECPLKVISKKIVEGIPREVRVVLRFECSTKGAKDPQLQLRIVVSPVSDDTQEVRLDTTPFVIYARKACANDLKNKREYNRRRRERSDKSSSSESSSHNSSPRPGDSDSGFFDEVLGEAPAPVLTQLVPSY